MAGVSAIALPTWGTSKNYLRCHCCVKNKLKMLIYNL